MSNTFLCLSDTMSFLNQEHSKDSPFAYSPFSGKSPKTNDGKLQPVPQDENNYSKNNSNTTVDCISPKQTVSRKREASNILMECVKRRENLRNISSTSDMPCDSFEYRLSPAEAGMAVSAFLRSDNEQEWDLEKACLDDEACSADLSDSSVTDSGIECSKSNSPIHSVETSSTSGLEEDISENLMDIDDIEFPVPKVVDLPKISGDFKLSPKSVERSAADDLNDLHLTDTLSSLSSDEVEIIPKPPLIISLFKHVPSIIYFSTKDEAVSSMPDHILQTMKWKLSTITPVVIRQAVTKAGFSFVDAETTEAWVGTWGKHLKCSTFKKLKSFQKVNHYPGGFHLGRKDRLWQNYNKMLSRHGSEAYNFFPESFILPAGLKSLKEAWGNEGEKCWIVKPCASARGTGVKVIYKWSQVPKNKPFVVQRYISNPYLINGSKFDLRLYILISSFEPLRIYVFEDGLVRFASEKYSLSNKSFANRYIHLTNYSINKKSSSYTSNDDENICQGHKWSLKSFWTYMSNSGIDVERIQRTIKDLIIKTILSAEGPICRLAKSHARSAFNCFELFGFDIMLDKNLHPWLLEVNISPSLHTKSKLDNTVKGSLVKDMLNIVGFEVCEKKENLVDNCFSRTVGNRHKPLKNRWFSPAEKRKHALYTFRDSDIKTDILAHLSPDDLHCLVESEDELNRKGSFMRIFPTETTSQYFPYFDHIRYYNVLLDAWEKSFHSRRGEGIRLLQDMYEKLLEPQNVEGSSELNTKNGA